MTDDQTASQDDDPSEGEAESLSGTTFLNRSLRRTRFVSCDLSDAVVRGSDVAGMEIDSPWLLEDGGRLLVNGVDVVPFVDAELNRRFPGRELRLARDPGGLRSAWAAVESAWAATLARATAMPDGTVDSRVDGEWSLAQTLQTSPSHGATRTTRRSTRPCSRACARSSTRSGSTTGMPCATSTRSPEAPLLSRSKPTVSPR